MNNRCAVYVLSVNALLFVGCAQPPASQSPQAVSQPPAAIESATVHGAAKQSRVVESSWIRPVVGEEEDSVGARVESVEAVADSDTVAVGIALPADRNIEEVTVYGRSKTTRRTPIIQPAKIEVLSSPEKNGIVIYLPGMEDFSLRINYYEAPSDVVPDLIND